MDEKMIDITNEAHAVVDIWEYAEKLNELNLLQKHAYDNKLIESVYAGEKDKLHHVLLFGKIYIVIVIDTEKPDVIGHYMLNLNEEYSTVNNLRNKNKEAS